MFKEAFCTPNVRHTSTYMSNCAVSTRIRGSVQLVQRCSMVPATCQRTRKRLTQPGPSSYALQPATILADCSPTAVERTPSAD